MKRIIALALLASAALPWPASAADFRVVPNSPWQSGINGAVILGDASSAIVTATITAESGRTVRAIWLYFDGQWSFYVPSLPMTGAQGYAGPISVMVVLS